MAIPDADTIIAAFESSGYVVTEKGVRAAVQEARSLARWPVDEPAAVFFAFARRPRCIPALNATLAAFLARDQIERIGVSLVATDRDLHDLRMHVLSRSVTFDDVRDWFAERMPSD